MTEKKRRVMRPLCKFIADKNSYQLMKLFKNFPKFSQKHRPNLNCAKFLFAPALYRVCIFFSNFHHKYHYQKKNFQTKTDLFHNHLTLWNKKLKYILFLSRSSNILCWKWRKPIVSKTDYIYKYLSINSPYFFVFNWKYSNEGTLQYKNNLTKTEALYGLPLCLDFSSTNYSGK